MAVDVIYDPEKQVGCLVCTTSDVAFGPIFQGADAREQAEDFRAWFFDGTAARFAESVGIKTTLRGFNGHDPRHYDDPDLERLRNLWRGMREVRDERDRPRLRLVDEEVVPL